MYIHRNFGINGEDGEGKETRVENTFVVRNELIIRSTCEFSVKNILCESMTSKILIEITKRIFGIIEMNKTIEEGIFIENIFNNVTILNSNDVTFYSVTIPLASFL